MTAASDQSERPSYDVLIGTGGIGSGTFFALNGNHTLGREESRGGRFLDRDDYCKLHIIAHYVRALAGHRMQVIPAGKVGDDDTGRRLLAEMADVGLDLRYTPAVPGEQTLNCICFVYPDGAGGNLTVTDSASSKVTPEFVAGIEAELVQHAGKCIVLALPEVPLAARARLLELGTRHRCLRAASFLVEEIPAVRDSQLLSHVDLLALNIDEAAALADTTPEQPPDAVARSAVEAVCRLNAGVRLSVTAGRGGSWVWDGQRLEHRPACAVDAVSTAGAGDAHFAGMLVALAAGLPLRQAHELGVLTAAMSVTSPHTIDKRIEPGSLVRFARDSRLKLSRAVEALLGRLGACGEASP